MNPQIPLHSLVPTCPFPLLFSELRSLGERCKLPSGFLGGTLAEIEFCALETAKELFLWLKSVFVRHLGFQNAP